MEAKTQVNNFFLFLQNFSLSVEENLFEKPEEAKTKVETLSMYSLSIPKYTNEFWTAKQRQASRLHELSYRACFKAQLPRFFIQAITKKGDIVYDPFSGRGTTALEACLLGRKGFANDVSPLSKILLSPRLDLPWQEEVEERLEKISLKKGLKADIDLSMFYSAKTEAELVSLKKYLVRRKKSDKEDKLDSWIRMVATNRLTGHSPGFFSVYTLPPNQAVSQESQIKINKKRNQAPSYKDVKKIILKKSASLLKNVTEQERKNLKGNKKPLLLTGDARKTKQIKAGTVQLTVTSPPFLDIVQYAKDNWLRCWFNGIDARAIEKKITMSRKLEDWCLVMGDVFKELYRLTKKGGFVAFEVGEVRHGKVKLDEAVVPLGIDAGFECLAIVVNQQSFTKTANIWGVKNNSKGTNTNRIVVFRKN